MLGIHDYWLFVATGILLNVTPGQDTLYILGRSIGQGTRIGVASVLGIGAGLVFHTVMAAAGLSVVLAASAHAFTVVKLGGAAYLVYLGVRMLTLPVTEEGVMYGASEGSALTAFRDGAVTNILNPKVALFFLALMPQFIEPGSDTKVLAFTVLGLTFIVTGTVWCLVLAVYAGRARDIFMRHPQWMKAISRGVGGVFILLGLRLAASRQ